jgi:2,3-dihydroxyphenylpropionate 1,2-dioxygenase
MGLGALGLPIVPLFQNCVAPPLPPLARYLALGAAIADVFAQMEPGLRVALLGTGGLSHEVPLPDWRQLAQDAEGEHWLRFMSAGRSGADAATLERIGAEVDRWGTERRGRIDADFDRELLAWMQAGDYARFAELDADTLLAEHATWLAGDPAPALLDTERRAAEGEQQGC